MPAKPTPPLPIFDSLEYLDQQSAPVNLKEHEIQDYDKAQKFLESYNGGQATFNAYRREVERLLHWSWLVAEKSVKDLRREDIADFLEFCQAPPLSWIGTKKAPRFIVQQGKRIANTEWRPFVATVSKAAHRKGNVPNPKMYKLSQAALQGIFAILSRFYNFLIQEDYALRNPVIQIRQKSKYLHSQQSKPKIRRLSELQWQYVIATAEQMAESDPDQHERTLFMMTALYAMYLRISELAASKRWIPKMNDFFRDHDGLWWFTTVGKGNKERQISVSNAMLEALKRYRLSLNLTPLPSPADYSPLFPKTKGKGPITSTTHIREIVQHCFDAAIERLKKDGLAEDGEGLLEATVHWLRHTGISDDVQHRPREHVRDDAGHSSSAITDKYIDVELRERHRTKKNAVVKQD